jgi:glutamine amidotransferase-like uncharacterized protein
MYQRLMAVIILTTLVSCLLNPFGTELQGSSLNYKNCARPLNVAIFAGRRVWYEGKTACLNMFKWMNLSVAFVYADDIRNGSLSDFDLLCMPGGWAYSFYEDLQEDGASKILDFVRSGGAYLGICAGAFYTCDYIIWEGIRYDYPIGLFPGYGVGPLDEIPWPNYNMTRIDIVNHTHPITLSEPAYEHILYYGGPELHSYEGTEVTILATYDVSSQPAIVVFEYGAGRVFLCGPHPEIEENSFRDGASFGEEFDDQGSDWPLMYEAIKWLVLHEDVNGDEMVNIVDLFLVAIAFGSKLGDPKWNARADVTNDGSINIIDIRMVARKFGKSL